MTLRANASRRITTAVCTAALAASVSAQSTQLADYKPARQISGTIHICGSPQMGDLLKLYEQAFTRLQPAVHFDEDLQSTLTAISGVSSGHADIGLLGREIWPTEIQAFTSVTNHAPTVIDIATGSYDVPKATFALMIFVPTANPIASLSTAQLARIFGADQPIRTWGELGLTGDWATRPIHLYGFTTDNDKSQIFSQLIFAPGDHWNPTLHQFANAPAPAATDAGELILQAVASDPDAIGISNVHYATSAVKTLALSTPPAHTALIPPTRANVANRTYPLTRAVYMVIDSGAAHLPTPAVLEFLRYALSRQGQQAVIREGNYLPLPPEVALHELRKLPAY